MSTDNLELLDKIQYPEDLRQLPVEQLPELVPSCVRIS